MILLVLGLLVFFLVHLSGSLFPDFRKTQKEKLGANAYRGIYTVLSIIGIVLIVFGWRATGFHPVYFPGNEMRIIGSTLMILSVYLLFVAQVKTNVKRMVRHPQLLGGAIWSIAHLLMNGDTRSIVLFASFGVWALLEIVLINHRDGQWSKPEAVSLAIEVRNFVGAGILFAVLVFAHPYIAGVPIPF